METINLVIGPRYHSNQCFLIPTICLDFPEPGGLIVWADWTWFGLYFGMVDDETLKNFGD